MLTDTQRKMASIQEIATLSPIENSDFLEVATMKDLGWKVVVKKGEFKPGDKVVYFEIDSAINVKDLSWPLQFLKDKGTKKLFTGRTPDTSAFSEEYVHIKTIKLRGQVSQGLIVEWDKPLCEDPNTHETRWMADYISPADMDIPENFRGIEVGFDLTKAFHVEVWDRLREWFDERSQLGPRAQMHSAGDFPSDVPKTDEERVQSAYSDLVKDPANVDGEWEVTEKNDGSSCTLFYRPLVWPDDPMRIASRKFLLKDDGFSDDWFAAFKKIGWDKIKSRLEGIYKHGLNADWDDCGPRLHYNGGHELAIQGEMIGAKFNGNRDKNTENHFRVFRIFDITDQKFVCPKIRYEICQYLGLEHVKVIETCQIFHKLKTVDDFIAYADGVTDNGNPREGVVFKRVNDGSVSFKSVSNKYLLKNGD